MTESGRVGGNDSVQIVVVVIRLGELDIRHDARKLRFTEELRGGRALVLCASQYAQCKTRMAQEFWYCPL
jgi:hypothetical protein